MAIRLDHLMWGAASLETGIEVARRLFGVSPAPGGVHPGLGTCNALLSLGDDQYLEVIAPDTAQQLVGNLGARLTTLDAPGLVTWAAATTDLDALASAARGASLRVRGPVLTERQAPDGTMLRWRLLFLGDHPFGGLLPFFIDWMDTPHPARTNPVAGRLVSLDVRTSDADRLNAVYDHLGIAVRAMQAPEAQLAARIDCDDGEIVLRSAPGALKWSL